MSKLTLLIILDIINKMISSKKIFKVPFKFYSISPFYTNQSHPLTEKFLSEIVIEILIGNPPQKFNASLNLNSYHSYFLSEDIPGIHFEKYYNSNLSSTYFCVENNSLYWDEEFQMAEIFSDNLKFFDNDSVLFDNKFYFLLVHYFNYNEPVIFYTTGIIGLRIRSFIQKQEDKEKRFTNQIKKLGLVNNEVFSFEFDKNKSDNGYLVIGKEIKKDYFLQIQAGILKMKYPGLEWSFNFDNVYYGNIEIKNSNDALLKTENGLIVGSTEYEKIISKYFFNNVNKCNITYRKMGYGDFKYYYCDEDFDVSQMEDLVFFLKNINFNFTLKSSDLFFNENGKKYFKILFLFSYNLYWYLGREFLKIYQLHFDMDKKLIYIPIKNENETESSNSSNFKIFHFWLTFVLGILVIFLVIYIARYLKKYPRKKRANELEDDFEYTIQENLNNKIIN